MSCTGLKEVYFPASVEQMSFYVILGCPNVKKIRVTKFTRLYEDSFETKDIEFYE